MSTKEKAIELYNKFRNENSVMSANIRAKKQALMCVDEIMKELISIESNYNLDFHSDILPYWEEVKIEIEALS